jgi:hypothetical protein
MRIRCRLGEIMRARGLTNARPHAPSGVSREVSGELRRNRFERVGRDTRPRALIEPSEFLGQLDVGIRPRFDRHAMGSLPGFRGVACESGIAALPAWKLVVHLALIAQGEGTVCALIFVYQVRRLTVKRDLRGDDETIVVLLLGYGWMGTLPGVRILDGLARARAAPPV